MSIFTSDKKKYFQRKLQNTREAIWGLEFKKFQTIELREQIRKDRDRAKEAVDAFEAELKRDHKEGTTEALEKQKAEAQENADRFEAQIKMLDAEVAGRPYVSPEDQGEQGITDNIAALNEMVKMFVSYINTL